MKRARATESFWPTRPNRTSPAPTAASVRMKKTDAPAARLRGVALRLLTEDPQAERDHEHEGEAARGAVGELDHGLEGGGAGHDLAVAERPVGAAAGAGPGGAHECAPQDDGHVPAEDEPGEPGETHRDASLRASVYRRAASRVAGVSASSFSYQFFFRIHPVTSRTSAEIHRPLMSRSTM